MFPRGFWGYYIHIGVGSNVVCSTTIGDARASIRGMDNSDSTLFCVEHRTDERARGEPSLLGLSRARRRKSDSSTDETTTPKGPI